MSSVRLSGVRVVVLDLDDTLYPERSFAYSGFDAVADWLRARVPCPANPAARMRELFESGDRGRVFDRLLSEWGVAEADVLVPEMIACYRAHAPKIRLFDDAEAALTGWSGRFKLGIISDGPAEMQEGKIDALGLAGRLDRIILTDRWGRPFWKPHPRAFEEIEREWGASGPQCVYLADNPAKDFIVPRDRGWQSVLVRREGGIYADASSPAGGAADAEVASLADVDLSL